MPREPCREDLRHAVTPFPHCAADNVPASIADLRNVAVSVSVGKNTAETARAQMEKYAKFCTSPINLALTLLAPTFGERLAPEQRPWKFHCIVDCAPLWILLSKTSAVFALEQTTEYHSAISKIAGSRLSI